MEERILYLMHVPWGWIKQRPHFIAEQLGRYYNVDVFYLNPIIRRDHVKNSVTNIKRIFGINTMPLVWKSPKLVEIYTNAFLVKKLKMSDYDIIWFTAPNIYFGEILKHVSSSQTVVYDCMDDILEFPSIKQNSQLREKTSKLEKHLVERSDIVFASSMNLKKVLLLRHSLDDTKIRVVNNAISDEFINTLVKVQKNQEIHTHDEILNKILKFMNNSKIRGKMIVTYVGTLDEWIDMDLIRTTIKHYSNIEYWLIGPRGYKVKKILNSKDRDRIKIPGPVKHEDLPFILLQSDLLVMPFKINRLIRSVDPVKAYEYISSGKPTLLVRYGETLKFKQYSYLYGNKREYLKFIKQLSVGTLNNKKYDPLKFAQENTWKQRVKEIKKALETV